MVAVTVLLAVATTLTALLKLATYTWALSGVTTAPTGAPPTVTVAVTLFVAVSITESVPSVVFGTYKVLPSGLIAARTAPFPTVIVATIVFVAVLMVETVPGFRWLFTT